MNILPIFLAGAMLAICSGLALAQSTLDSDLRHSEQCTRAVANFRKQPEWKDEAAMFTSHFNKKMGKCLVKVTRSSVVSSGEVLEMQHVYDALEGSVIGGQIITKELPHDGEQKVLGILMVRDGKLLGKNDPDKAREANRWFNTLMSD